MDLHFDNILISIGGKERSLSKLEAMLLSNYLSDTLNPALKEFKKVVNYEHISWDPKILNDEEHLQYCKEYLKEEKSGPLKNLGFPLLRKNTHLNSETTAQLFLSIV